MATSKDDVSSKEWPSEGGTYHRESDGTLKQDHKPTKEAPLIPDAVEQPESTPKATHTTHPPKKGK